MSNDRVNMDPVNAISASSEICSAIHFLPAEGRCADEIHHQMGWVTVLSRTDAGNSGMGHRCTWRGWSPRTTFICEWELVKKVCKVVKGRKKRRFTISDFSNELPHISKANLFRTVTESLVYKKFCVVDGINNWTDTLRVLLFGEGLQKLAP